MKKLLLLFILATSLGYAQSDLRTISGRVSDGKELLPNVEIFIEASGERTLTNEEGYYTIKASPGETITYRHQGFKTLQIAVEDVTTVLNPVMLIDVEELDEVVVRGRNRMSQKDLAMEYQVNPRIIRTAYGYMNADTAPGNIRFLNAEEISPIGLCILDVLRGYFAGVRVVGSCAGVTGVSSNNQQISAFGAVYIRGVSSILNPRSAIFDVDGQIYTIPPVWINVQNMKRIAILNNFATVTQYGSLATGGVVVINTFSGSRNRGENIDFARLTNNYFNDDVLLSQDRILQNSPIYLQDLMAAKDKEMAVQTFEKWNEQYGSSPYFILDAYRYFYNIQKDATYADKLVESNFRKFENNPVLLKALAYHYEAQQRYKEAHELYRKVYMLRPAYSQSYLDLIRSYRNIGEMQKAATIYNRYKYLQEEQLMSNDTTEFTPIIYREYNNLLTLHREKILDEKSASNLYVLEEDYFKGTRLVFEWNDGEAEFDLQFVNPGNQYFTFNHSLAENGDLIMREKQYGFSTTEYLIDNSLQGTWKINARYRGNKSLTPSYLKTTVYYNYGTSSQQIEIKVFKLSVKGNFVELFKLANGSTIPAR